MADNRKYVVPAAVAGGCILVFIIFALIVFTAAGLTGGRRGGARVGLIHVTGIITAGKSGGGVFSSGSAGSEDIVRQLEQARKSKNIKAVVIRINSPGGSPAGSEEVYNEIYRVRRAGKPVYVSMGDVAASGGYYIAAAADRIFADAASITGSIGVIYEGPELSELFKKIGVDFNVITTGKYKDLGNPARPMTPEERALIKNMIMDTYDQFVDAVSKGRKMRADEVRKIVDGRVFTGRQAKQLGLIDEIGGLRETVVAAGRAGGIDGEPKVFEFRRDGLIDILLGADSAPSSSRLMPALKTQLLRFLLNSEDYTFQGLR